MIDETQLMKHVIKEGIKKKRGKVLRSEGSLRSCMQEESVGNNGVSGTSGKKKGGKGEANQRAR